MFFTVLSKTVFSNSDNPRVYFNLFAMGIILYALLHYYLNSEDRGNLLGNVNKYIYYIVSADFILGAYLLKPKKPETKKSKTDDEGSKYTKEQQMEILKNLQNAKAATKAKQSAPVESPTNGPFIKKEPDKTHAENQQHAKQQHMVQQANKANKVEQVPEKPKKPVKESESSELVVKKKSDHSEKRTPENEVVDTDLPMFNEK